MLTVGNTYTRSMYGKIEKSQGITLADITEVAKEHIDKEKRDVAWS